MRQRGDRDRFPIPVPINFSEPHRRPIPSMGLPYPIPLGFPAGVPYPRGDPCKNIKNQKKVVNEILLATNLIK